MEDEFELKRITPDGIPAAIKRAEHYRLLNQPEQAESICLDVLELQPDHQQALVVAILAITDQFVGGAAPAARTATQLLERLTAEYERLYYGGIIAERRGRAALTRGRAQQLAYFSLREAIELFEKAAMIRPAGNDDAILRWNACVRTIRRHRLEPRPDVGELGLE